MSDVAARRRRKRLRGAVAAFSSLVASVVLAFVLWEALVVWYEIPAYVLPAPKAVIAALLDGLGQHPTSRSSFWYHLADTLTATVSPGQASASRQARRNTHSPIS